MVVSELTGILESLPDLKRSFDRIDTLEEQLSHSRATDEFNAIRKQLCEMLATLRHETLYQRQQISDLISNSIARMRASGDRQAAAAARAPALMPDPLTGLPGRTCAEAELLKAHLECPDGNMALFVAHRLNLINAKFGFRRGDQVLLSVIQHLKQITIDFNNLFRWTPCSFLAITASTVPIHDLRHKVQSIELQRITPTLEWEGRTALVPVNLSARVYSIRDYETPDLLVQALDNFAAKL